MTAAAEDLTTLATVKQWVGIPTGTTTDDALIQDLITACSVFILSWMTRDIKSQSYTEYYDGVGGNRLFLANYPITAVASLSVDGLAIPAASSVLGPGYRFTNNIVSLNGYKFGPGDANILITYTAGFASVPADLARAATEMVGYKYKEKDRIGVSSKTLASEVVSFTVKDMPDTVKTTLKQYKMVAPA